MKISQETKTSIIRDFSDQELKCELERRSAIAEKFVPGLYMYSPYNNSNMYVLAYFHTENSATVIYSGGGACLACVPGNKYDDFTGPVKLARRWTRVLPDEMLTLCESVALRSCTD